VKDDHDDRVRRALDILNDPWADYDIKVLAREFLGLEERRVVPEYRDATTLTCRTVRRVRVR
jgi:hypothetical protein